MTTSTRATKKTREAGLSLLEVIVALIILAGALWSFQTLYVGLLKGTSRNEARLAAVSEAKTLYKIWSKKGRDPWPDDLNPAQQNNYIEVPYGNYIYSVEINGLTENPFYDASVTPAQDPYLQIRAMTVTLFYTDSSAQVDPAAPGGATKKTVVLKGAVAK